MKRSLESQTSDEPLIAVIISGSVAAINAAGLVHAIGSKYRRPTAVILTCAAERFVTHDALVYGGGAEYVLRDDDSAMFKLPTHMWIASRALALLVYPATADFIGKTAAGLAMDLATTSFLASYGKPRMLVPSMNPLMWANPLVQRNLAILRDNQVAIAASEDGIAPRIETVLECFEEVFPANVGLHASSSSSDVRRS